MKKMNTHFLTKLNRMLVWPTLVLFTVYIFFGYGITNPKLISELTGGILTHSLSIYLHTTLALPVLLLLLTHVLIGMRTALTRWGVKEGKLLSAFLILPAAFAIVSLITLQTFRSE